jgi:hypothetical protein
MARYFVPPNTGKVRVAMGLGGAWAVWNGKSDNKHEFRILVRTKRTAEELATVINSRQHFGVLDVVEAGVIVMPEEEAKVAIAQELKPSRTETRKARR